MTKEQKALKNLKDILAEATMDEISVCYVTGEDKETLEIAIKALEQQPSEDCVSRAEVLKGYIEIQRADGVEMYSDKAIPVEYVKALPPATPTFPKGATNGNMIKAMFPYGKYGTNGNEVHVFGVGGNGCLVFTLDWWNAPYKRGSENGRN